MEAAVALVLGHLRAGSRITVARRLRRGRRLLDGDPGGLPAAAGRRGRLAPALAPRRRLWPVPGHGRRAGQARDPPAGDRGLRDHGGGRGGRRPGRGDRRGGHRPPPAARRRPACRRRRSCTPRSGATRAPTCAPPRWPPSWPRRWRPPPAGTGRESTATWTWWPWPPWPTACPCGVRTGAWCARACGRWPPPPSPGLRALMEVSALDPGAIDAHAAGFRLAPRINAAGRLDRADAGLELVLTEDEQRARAIARELDEANARRRDVETRILFAAEAQVAQRPGQPAYVLAGEDWHPGVIGIVASRIAERHHRPAVLIALHGERGTGSGRSIPAFDLLGALNSCAAHLARHGGHRAAAGLEIERQNVPAFARAFAEHAAATLTADDLVAAERVDAVVGGDALGLPAAEELERLAPFGVGNPRPTLLVPAATFAQPVAMGEGRHLRFAVHGGGRPLPGRRLRGRRSPPAGGGRHGGGRNLPPGAQRVEGRSGAPPGPELRARRRRGRDRGGRRGRGVVGGAERPARPGARALAAAGAAAASGGARADRPPRPRHRRGPGRPGRLRRAGAGGVRGRSAAPGRPARPAGRLCPLLVGGAGARPARWPTASRTCSPWTRRRTRTWTRWPVRAGRLAPTPIWPGESLSYALPGSINEHEYGLRASLVSLFRLLRDGDGAAGEGARRRRCEATPGTRARQRWRRASCRSCWSWGWSTFDAERRAVSVVGPSGPSWSARPRIGRPRLGERTPSDT